MDPFLGLWIYVHGPPLFFEMGDKLLESVRGSLDFFRAVGTLVAGGLPLLERLVELDHRSTTGRRTR